MLIQGEGTTVSRLTPYAEYEIRVRAHNAAGDGPLSAPQLCKTDEDGAYLYVLSKFVLFLLKIEIAFVSIFN